MNPLRLAPGAALVAVPGRGPALRTPDGDFLRVDTGTVPPAELMRLLDGGPPTGDTHPGDPATARLLAAFDAAGYLAADPDTTDTTDTTDTGDATDTADTADARDAADVCGEPGAANPPAGCDAVGRLATGPDARDAGDVGGAPDSVRPPAALDTAGHLPTGPGTPNATEAPAVSDVPDAPDVVRLLSAFGVAGGRASGPDVGGVPDVTRLLAALDAVGRPAASPAISGTPDAPNATRATVASDASGVPDAGDTADGRRTPDSGRPPAGFDAAGCRLATGPETPNATAASETSALLARTTLLLLGDPVLTGPLTDIARALGADPVPVTDPRSLGALAARTGPRTAVVWCLDRPVPPGLWDIPDQLSRDGVGWLRCHREGAHVWLEPPAAGPVGVTAADVRLRRLAATPAHRELAAYWAGTRTADTGPRHTAASAAYTAALLTRDLVAWARGEPGPGHPLLRRLDLRDLTLSAHPVLPVPACAPLPAPAATP
ncbi:hypothetical protein [Streptomyces yaizuensis]|uniref:Uncharacterized protein n=1 Tax=Streptomyces yaizuensis TaxID=2989713 RepID=A0ABQ5NYI6_9ACTN|nr:hypothetical protein SYYSPA8_11985 [Streptomyces sp. YSPA8]